MSEATSGFIYLWYDSHHKMFYLGRHWGTLEDGYVCSSNWMKRAIKARPQHFKRRRILEWIHTTREDLADAEYRWGLLIKKEELGKRYYNLKPPGDRHWHDYPDKHLSVKQKISKRTKEAMANPEVRARYEAGLATRKKSDYIPTEEHIRSLKDKFTNVPLSEAHRKALSEAQINSPSIKERSQKASDAATKKRKTQGLSDKELAQRRVLCEARRGVARGSWFHSPSEQRNAMFLPGQVPDGWFSGRFKLKSGVPK